MHLFIHPLIPVPAAGLFNSIDWFMGSKLGLISLPHACTQLLVPKPLPEPFD
jgi:hypothetical protein